MKIKEEVIRFAPDLKENLGLITMNDELYVKLSILGTNWVTDVLACISLIPNNIFTTSDIYQFKYVLQAKHPENHTIEAKIRQQLQFLRDNGLLEFDGNGHYKKLF